MRNLWGKESWEVQCGALGNVCWKMWGPGIHVDVPSTPIDYLTLFQYIPQRGSRFPGPHGLFQLDKAHWHTENIVQEEHDKDFKLLTWPPNSPDINLIEHL